MKKKYHDIGTMPRKIMWLGSSFLFLLTGLAAGQRLLVVVAQTMFIIFLLCRLYLQLNLRAIAISRSLVAKAFEGESLVVNLHICYLSWLPLKWLYIHEYFGADINSNKEFLLSRPVAQQTQIEYEAECRKGRGNFRIGPVELTLSDPLGLWLAKKKFAVDSLLVLPRIVPLAYLPGGISRMPCFASDKTIYKPGASHEFLGTREYRPGDNLKYIHWPATAHNGELIIKEFQQHTTSRIVIVIDLSTRSLQGIKPNTLDYSITIAASIAQYAVNHSQEFRLLAHGRYLHNLPFGKGTGHLNWLLEQMAVMKPFGNIFLHEVINNALPSIEAGEEMVIIFPTHSIDPQQYIDAFTILQAKKVSLTAIFLISESFETLYQYSYNEFMIHSQLPALLTGRGIQVIAVEKGADISKCFAEGI